MKREIEENGERGGEVVGDTTFKARRDRSSMHSRFRYLYPLCLPMRIDPLQGKR
jgi:hypothetical protein